MFGLEERNLAGFEFAILSASMSVPSTLCPSSAMQTARMARGSRFGNSTTHGRFIHLRMTMPHTCGHSRRRTSRVHL